MDSQSNVPRQGEANMVRACTARVLSVPFAVVAVAVAVTVSVVGVAAFVARLVALGARDAWVAVGLLPPDKWSIEAQGAALGLAIGLPLVAGLSLVFWSAL